MSLLAGWYIGICSTIDLWSKTKWKSTCFFNSFFGSDYIILRKFATVIISLIKRFSRSLNTPSLIEISISYCSPCRWLRYPMMQGRCVWWLPSRVPYLHWLPIAGHSYSWRCSPKRDGQHTEWAKRIIPTPYRWFSGNGWYCALHRYIVCVRQYRWKAWWWATGNWIAKYLSMMHLQRK